MTLMFRGSTCIPQSETDGRIFVLQDCGKLLFTVCALLVFVFSISLSIYETWQVGECVMKMK
jgi:hypothetical protein